MGETTGAIQQAGGWKSEMMAARYTAHLASRDSAAARVAEAKGDAVGPVLPESGRDHTHLGRSGCA